MYMSICVCVHVRSRFTAPLNSGCEVSKQKQKIVFGMGSLGWISSWRKSEQKKNKNQTHLRLNTGCTDRESRETSIPPSPRAPRPRERERIGVLSLGFMDIRASGGSGGNGKNKTHQPENGKLKEKREIGNPPKPTK